VKSLPLTLTGNIKPARAITITRRDGTVYRATDAQVPFTISSLTYSPLGGLVVGAIKHTLGGEAASTQIDVVHSDGGTFDTADIFHGRFDSALVTVGIFDRASATSVGTLFTGKMQPVSFSTDGRASFDVMGIATEHVGIFTQKCQPMCRADFGSTLCRVPILPVGDWFLEETPRSTAVSQGLYARHQFATNGTPDDYANRYLEVTTAGTTAGSPPSFSSTVGNTTNDGTAVWTTREAWARYARVGSIIDQHTITLTANPDATRAVDGWFDQGVLVMRSGASDGWAYEVGAWIQSTNRVTTYLPIGELVAVNDWLEIYPGCNFTLATGGCPKFSNELNFQGEPHFLGARAAAAVQT
jgi:hypothetical protein